MNDIESFRNSIENPSTTPKMEIFDPSANRVMEIQPARLPAHCDLDDTVYSIIDDPAHAGELPSQTYARKEREIAAVFAKLTVLESMAMHKRLSNPNPHDRLATRFARMISERRGRLLAFLADARRRAALGR